MVGPKERATIEELDRIGNELGFHVKWGKSLEKGHYHPDLIWEKDNKVIGFEVECSEKGASNKKFIGDAFWLNKNTNLGFIIVRGKKKSLNVLLEYLKGDNYFDKVHIIDNKNMKVNINKILQAHF